MVVNVIGEEIRVVLAAVTRMWPPTDFNAGINDFPFTGTVTIDGVPAPDGAVITAWVEGRTSSTSFISFTATDGTLVSAPGSVVIVVLAKRVQIGTAVVTGGAYSLFASQLAGEAYTAGLLPFRRTARLPIKLGPGNLGERTRWILLGEIPSGRISPAQPAARTLRVATLSDRSNGQFGMLSSRFQRRVH